MNKKSRRELLLKQKTCDKKRINGAENNQMQKKNDGDEEISLFI